MNNDQRLPSRRQRAAVTAPVRGSRARSRLIAAAAAGGPPTAVAGALAMWGRPGLAAVVGALSMVTASFVGLAAGPVGETLARGYVERRLLREATAEARRTDEASAAVAVALIDALDRRH